MTLTPLNNLKVGFVTEPSRLARKILDTEGSIDELKLKPMTPTVMVVKELLIKARTKTTMPRLRAFGSLQNSEIPEATEKVKALL